MPPLSLRNDRQVLVLAAIASMAMTTSAQGGGVTNPTPQLGPMSSSAIHTETTTSTKNLLLQRQLLLRQLEGMDYVDDYDHIDDDMDDENMNGSNPLAVMLPQEAVTVTNHGISDPLIDKMVWDDQAIEAFEKAHPVKIQQASDNSSKKKNDDNKERNENSMTMEQMMDLQIMEMQERSDNVGDEDFSDDLDESSSKKSGKPGKRSHKSKRSNKKKSKKYSDDDDHTNLRRSHKSSKSSKSSKSKTSEDDYGGSSYLPSAAPSEAPSVVHSQNPSHELSASPSLRLSHAPTRMSETTMVPTATPTMTFSSEEEIVEDNNENRDDEDGEEELLTETPDGTTRRGRLTALMALGLLVAGAVGFQVSSSRQNGPRGGDDQRQDPEDDGNIQEGDDQEPMETVDL